MLMNLKTFKYESGIQFFDVLFFIFLTLKLTDQIDWSWWWITAPLWIPFCFAIVLMFFVGLSGVGRR